MSSFMAKPAVVDEGEMSPELDAAIRRALCLGFPADAAVFARTRKWHGSSPAYSVVIRNGEEVLAHVGVVDRRVRFGGREVRAAGIQNVLVLPQHRGQHLSDLVMQVAQEEAARRGFDCGLLFCVPTLASLYARMGWLALASDVVRVDDDGALAPIPGKNIGMFLPLRLRHAPPGLLHLGGNDW
jgi:predicted N-acetyltransferase YhbS